MAKLKISNDWWTAPAEGDGGGLVMVTGRRALDNVVETGDYRYRLEVTWIYDGDSQGMPSDETSRLMERATDALQACFDRDPVAVLTGIYTGDGERNYIFYTKSLAIFQRKFNAALADIEPTLPLQFYATEDPLWEGYREMCETEVAEGGDD